MAPSGAVNDTPSPARVTARDASAGPASCRRANEAIHPGKRAGSTSSHLAPLPATSFNLDVEAERAELFAAVFCDVLRAPRRHPDPVDPEVGDHAVQGLACLVLDH